MGKTERGFLAVPWGKWDGVRQVEVRSGPKHLNCAQDFAPEKLCSNLRTRNTVLLHEEMKDST